jgi:hypothetical protein
MKKAICFLLIAVTGCCNMDEVMTSWEGCHINEVIAQWGYPDSQQEIAGRTLYRWGDSGSMYVPQTSTTYGHVNAYGGYTANTYYSGGYNVQLYCIRTLEVDSRGYVISWQYEGNNCSNSGWKNKNAVKANRATPSVYTTPPDNETSRKELLDIVEKIEKDIHNDPNQTGSNEVESISGSTNSSIPQQSIPQESQIDDSGRKIKGYQATTDPKTGKIVTYPVYEDEQKR